MGDPCWQLAAPGCWAGQHDCSGLLQSSQMPRRSEDEEQARSADRHRNSTGCGDSRDAQRYRDGERGQDSSRKFLARGRSRSPDRTRRPCARLRGRSWSRDRSSHRDSGGDLMHGPTRPGTCSHDSIRGRGGKSGPSRTRSKESFRNIEINKRITGSRDARELCALV